MTLGAVLIDRGALSEGEEWLARAEPTLTDAPEPPVGVGFRHAQGMLELARGRLPEALAAFREGERLTEHLRAPHFLAAVERQWQLRVQLRLGELEPVRAALRERGDGAEWCNLEGHLALAEDDPRRAADAVAPVLAGDAFAFHENQEIEAMLLDALARTRLDQPEAAERSVERALALAEPQGRVWILLTVAGAKELLQAHPMHRTAHAGHLKRLLDHLAGAQPEAVRDELPEPLSERELSVLRFLPTNLTAGDIANELFLSVHTVKTHMRKLYAKLDVHTRTEAVQRGRALGLLGPARRAD
jgi:LuxR family maltose regulon positive regulatory protein